MGGEQTQVEQAEAEQPKLDAWHGRTVLGLGGVSLLTDIHSESIAALLPQFMATELGMSMAFIGFVQGLAKATVAGIQLISGWLSDKLGVRKPFVFAGYAFSTVIKASLALATKPWHVLAIRVGDRAGKGIRTPPRDAMLADAVRETQWGKAYGLHRAMDSAGAIVGTALALALFNLTHSYRVTFAWVALGGVGAVFLLLFFVHEPPRPAAKAAKPVTLRGLPTRFWQFMIAYAIFSAGNVTYAFYLLRAQELGVPEALVPAVFLLHNTVYTFLGLPAGALSDHVGARLATLLTMGLHVLVCLGLAATGQAWVVVALTAVYGAVLAGEGSAVRALAAQLLPAHLRASGMAAYRAAGGLAMLPGSWLVGWLWDKVGAPAAWLVAAGLAAVGAALILATRPTSADGE